MAGGERRSLRRDTQSSITPWRSKTRSVASHANVREQAQAHKRGQAARHTPTPHTVHKKQAASDHQLIAARGILSSGGNRADAVCVHLTSHSIPLAVGRCEGDAVLSLVISPPPSLT